MEEEGRQRLLHSEVEEVLVHPQGVLPLLVHQPKRKQSHLHQTVYLSWKFSGLNGVSRERVEKLQGAEIKRLPADQWPRIRDSKKYSGRLLIECENIHYCSLSYEVNWNHLVLAPLRLSVDVVHRSRSYSA